MQMEIVVYKFMFNFKYLPYTGIVQKYSNFVGVPIYLNGKRANILQVGIFQTHSK